jgi:hypothetical protein
MTAPWLLMLWGKLTVCSEEHENRRATCSDLQEYHLTLKFAVVVISYKSEALYTHSIGIQITSDAFLVIYETQTDMSLIFFRVAPIAANIEPLLHQPRQKKHYHNRTQGLLSGLNPKGPIVIWRTTNVFYQASA